MGSQTGVGQLTKREAPSVLVPVLGSVGFDSAGEMEASGKVKVMKLTEFLLTQKMGETFAQV